MEFTQTNAYSGNNGRAAILNTAANTIYTAGNAGNGSKPEPQGVVVGTGSQILPPNNGPESGQTPGATTPMGNFNIVQTGAAHDTAAKDDNFRGLTISNNVVYMTKGSGSNGIDTVYFLDTTGASCPTIGTGEAVGLPSSTATLPNASTWTPPAYSARDATLSLTTSNPGLTPTNMCILKGFPTTPASGDGVDGLSVRHLVNRPDRSVRGGRGFGRRHLLDHDEHLHSCVGFNDRGSAEVDLQLFVGQLAARLHAPERLEPRRALHGT